MTAAEFNWEDPLDLESSLSEDERMIRDSARAFADSIAGGWSSCRGIRRSKVRSTAGQRRGARSGTDPSSVSSSAMLLPVPRAEISWKRRTPEGDTDVTYTCTR